MQRNTDKGWEEEEDGERMGWEREIETEMGEIHIAIVCRDSNNKEWEEEEDSEGGHR